MTLLKREEKRKKKERCIKKEIKKKEERNTQHITVEGTVRLTSSKQSIKS